MKDIIRRCHFSPYRKGERPTFTLVIWDAHRRKPTGQAVLGYKLTARYPNDGAAFGQTLFEGEDFGCSPLHVIGSDDAVEALMSFLTLRPGDTDSEYFANYTPEQMEFCQQHAEALYSEVQRRFCDENGSVKERAK